MTAAFCSPPSPACSAFAAFRWLRADAGAGRREVRGREDRRRMARAADAAAIRDPAQARHRAAGLQPAAQGASQGHLRLRRLRPAAVLPPRPSSRAAPAGRASINRSTTRVGTHRGPHLRACCAPRCIAAAAAAISAMSSTTVRSPPGLRYCMDGFALVFNPARRRRPDPSLFEARQLLPGPAIVPRSPDRGFLFKYLK